MERVETEPQLSFFGRLKEHTNKFVPNLVRRWYEPWYDQLIVPKTTAEEWRRLGNAYHDWILRIGVYTPKPKDPNSNKYKEESY